MDKPLKIVLKNGLKVILLEKHDAPVVAWNLWANVGSVNETDDIAGICHLIEHMIFKGTGRRPVGQIAKEVEAAGGDMNAYTSFDETVFYMSMSKRRMEVGLDVLADAATDPTFDETELTREKEVVVEEISRAEAEATWRNREKGHQLGTLASRQSLPLKRRGELSRRHAELRRIYATRDVPCPPTWVGYRVVPDEIEFWQREADRLHARERFARTRGGWRRELLNP